MASFLKFALITLRIILNFYSLGFHSVPFLLVLLCKQSIHLFYVCIAFVFRMALCAHLINQLSWVLQIFSLNLIFLLLCFIIFDFMFIWRFTWEKPSPCTPSTRGNFIRLLMYYFLDILIVHVIMYNQHVKKIIYHYFISFYRLHTFFTLLALGIITSN